MTPTSHPQIVPDSFIRFKQINQNSQNERQVDLTIYFSYISQLEDNLENHKKNLVIDCPEYNSIDAFRLMDEPGQGVVNGPFLQHFIETNFS